MSFNSFEFLGFFCGFTSLFFISVRYNRSFLYPLLIFGSLFFYVQSGWKSLPVLLFSLSLNFLSSKLFESYKTLRFRRRLFQITLAANIILLFGFKYSGWIGTYFFPLGISFFTLQQIIFIVDRYQGLQSHPSFLAYMSFVTFFPTITAGPIARWKDLGRGLLAWPHMALDWDRIARGIFLFTLGFSKKIMLADTFKQWVDLGFQYSQTLTTLEAWIAGLAYTFQIYFDFSGYSDMAIGIALILQISIPPNFDSPLKATNLIDFWKRWHISLSQFITSYLYTPLLKYVFSKVTLTNAMIATLIAMTIAGVWHGPSINYIIFGVIHGIGLVVNNLWRKKKYSCPNILGWLFTFLLVSISFVFFRAHNVDDSFSLFKAALHLTESPILGLPHYESLTGLDRALSIVVMIVGMALVFFAQNSNILMKTFKLNGRSLLMAIVLLIISLHFLNTVASKAFIYADF